MTRELKVGDSVVALVLDTADVDFGAHPISDPSAPLQVLMMKRAAGYVVAKHAHKKMDRVASTRQKAVVVISGTMKVVVCDMAGTDAEPTLLTAGQCLYLIDGGYKIDMQTECKFFEFKNGPHVEDKIIL